MAGRFEIIREGEGAFLFRLTAGDGTIVAVSPTFTTIEGVVDGIEAVRENAAAGFVVDRFSGTTDPGQACSSRAGGQLMDESSFSIQPDGNWRIVTGMIQPGAMLRLLQRLGGVIDIQPFTENGARCGSSIRLRTPGIYRTMPAPNLLPGQSQSGFSVGHVSLGVTPIILRPNARITDDDCVRTGAELLSLSGGRPGAVLLQITGVSSVTRAAISLYVEAAAVTACAILGGSPVDRVIGHSLLRLAPPKCPTQYFSDEEKADLWLRSVG